MFLALVSELIVFGSGLEGASPRQLWKFFGAPLRWQSSSLRTSMEMCDRLMLRRACVFLLVGASHVCLIIEDNYCLALARQ